MVPGVYAFDLFSSEVCAHIVADLGANKASLLPKRRPNTMNRDGLVINDIGYNSFVQFLIESVINRLFARYFGAELFPQTLDHHNTFSVAYKVGDESESRDAGSRGLEMHLGRDSLAYPAVKFFSRASSHDTCSSVIKYTATPFTQ